MKNLAIIGAGQLGSRHLQALAVIKEPVEIYIVDPSEESLIRSKERFDTVNSNDITLNMIQKISELPRNIEFAIIATNSLQRLKVLQEFLEYTTVKYLLLEKFLFPYQEQYQIAKQLLDNLPTKVFVNCAKTMWPKYVELKNLLSNEKSVCIDVEGENWNLASNAIHFMNLLSFFTNGEEYKVDISLLDKKLSKNKRIGYVEFTGTLIITINDVHKLRLKSIASENNPFYNVKIQSGNFNISIDEFAETISINGEIGSFPIMYQSDLTNLIYNQLQLDGKCNLVEFNKSCREHLVLLESFDLHLNGREGIIT